MDFAALIPYAVFIGFALGVWAMISFFSKTKSRADERLEELRDPTLRNKAQEPDEKQTGMGAMLGKAAPALSKALKPKTDLEANKLKVRMANAGFNAPGAPQVYLAIKIAMLVFGLMSGGGYGIFSWGMTQNGITSLVIGGGLGFYLPEVVLWFMIRSRTEKIFLSMPDSLDLLVVCVEAGLGLDAGMRRVSEELADTAPELCAEFDMANMQLQMGRPRREVLHDLGVRTGVDDMRSLAAILIQADKFGS